MAGLLVAGPVGTVASAGTTAAAPPSAPAGSVATAVPTGAQPAPNPCNPLATQGGGQCLVPFPSDFFTAADPSTPTGRRIAISAGAEPAGHIAQPGGSIALGGIDPAQLDRNDGFSPGSNILVQVPRIDLARSAVATISDMGSSLRRDSPIVLLDAASGKRWPTWSEVDVTDHDPLTQLLIVHPARNLVEGHRYLVALRDLKTASGAPIPPGPPFASILAKGVFPSGVSGPYASHERGVLTELARAGVSSKGMYLAWDFTVASTKNLTAPALAMRDQTFAALGDKASPYLVTSVVNDPPGNAKLARIVTGYFDVPSYLSGPGGATSSVMTYGPDGLPEHVAGQTDVANFECEIPKAASAAHPAAVGFYGHGLFGSADEVTQSGVPGFADAYDYAFCSTDWLGLSRSTLGLGAGAATDPTKFPALIDNLLQALLNAQVLGNLLVNPGGLAKSAAFEDPAHHPLIRPSSGLVYYGNSEGGIMGGAFTALSTQVHRSVLGVPGMDYSVLLQRSADFSPFQILFDKVYPDQAAQQEEFDLMQMLWDRADANGYAEQMTGGLPGTPHHQVLLEEAFGDHQVANITTETEARTIGAAVHQPALARGRSNEKQPFWDLPALTSGSSGPALFVWDTGVPPAPLANTPPTAGPDPHDTTPRTFPAFWRQMDVFFRTGVVTDPCGPAPCRGPRPVS